MIRSAVGIVKVKPGKMFTTLYSGILEGAKKKWEPLGAHVWSDGDGLIKIYIKGEDALIDDFLDSTDSEKHAYRLVRRFVEVNSVENNESGC